MEKRIAKDVTEYISWFPEETQLLLKELRNLIKKGAPNAEETISYHIPAYKMNGILIYFAGFQKHVSLYPAPRENAEFQETLSKYKGGKGTVQFPLNQPLPSELIKKIIAFRVTENNKKLKVK